MKPSRVLWAAVHALILALAVYCLDGLLLKFDRASADLVPAGLWLILFLALIARAMARRVPSADRDRLERVWCSLDAVGVAWAVSLVVLITVFHAAFERAGGDGREYFAQLRSMVIDRDLAFANEAREFGAAHAADFPFGSAILWMPFYLVAHAWLGALNAFGGGWRQDGYFYPYQMAIGLGTLAYGFAGLILVYRVTCEYFSRWLSFAATIVVTAGSFIVWYLTADNSYTHGNSLFAVTLFLFIWHRTRADRSLGAWGLLGLSGGLMLMVRWQSAVFLAPLALDLVSAGWRSLRTNDRAMLIRTVKGAAVAAAALVVAFLPQMLFWKVVNGGFFAVPHYQAGQQWWNEPLMTDVLFSSNHGLFAWHPILYLSVLGTPFLLKRDRRLGWILLALFVAQVYVNGAVTTWWGGTSFGGRRFDGCVLFFVLGLAALMQWSMERPAVVWSAVLAVFVASNIFFMQDIASGRLPMGQGIAADRIFGALSGRFGNPFSFPANAWFAWRYGTTWLFYDRLGLQLFTNVTIDVGEPDDDRFLASGWSGPERGRFGSYRWGITRESTVAVSLLGPRYVAAGEAQQFDDYVLRVRVAPYAFSGSPPQDLQVDVNGRSLATRTLEPGFRDYEIDVPPGFLKRSVNVITFRYSYARSPQELGRSSDTRPLAARFDYIHLVVKP